MTAEEFIFRCPPCRKITGDDNQELYAELTKDPLKVNGFNPVHNAETTYYLMDYGLEIDDASAYNVKCGIYDDNLRVLSFECGRFGDIMTILVCFDSEEGYIMKVGSNPSLRDFHKDDIKRYRKVLTPQQQQEFMTAIMIAANGVGIGSYVYLRRIFEDIVSEEAQKQIDAGHLDSQTFSRMRMDEKVIALKDYLPPFLSAHHKEIYGILSAGIHDLSEDFCLAYFATLYACITLILDDRLAQMERAATEANVVASLSKIHSMIGARKSNH